MNIVPSIELSRQIENILGETLFTDFVDELPNEFWIVDDAEKSAMLAPVLAAVNRGERGPHTLATIADKVIYCPHDQRLPAHPNYYEALDRCPNCEITQAMIDAGQGT